MAATLVENLHKTSFTTQVFIVNCHFVQHVLALKIIRYYNLRTPQGNIPHVCTIVFILKVF